VLYREKLYNVLFRFRLVNLRCGGLSWVSYVYLGDWWTFRTLKWAVILQFHILFNL
jgi:hypothetical protein